MLMAPDRDTPRMRVDTALPLACTEREIISAQEFPLLWFTLPILRFPMIKDEYQRPIHPEVEEYMRRSVTENKTGK